MLSNNQMKKAVVSTFLITSLIWGFPSVSLYLQSEQRNEEIAQLLEMGWNDVFECRISKINPDAHYENQIRLTIRIKRNEGK